MTGWSEYIFVAHIIIRDICLITLLLNYVTKLVCHLEKSTFGWNCHCWKYWPFHKSFSQTLAAWPQINTLYLERIQFPENFGTFGNLWCSGDTRIGEDLSWFETFILKIFYNIFIISQDVLLIQDYDCKNVVWHPVYVWEMKFLTFFRGNCYLENINSCLFIICNYLINLSYLAFIYQFVTNC